MAAKSPLGPAKRLKPELVSVVYANNSTTPTVPWSCHLYPHDRGPLYLDAAKALLSRTTGHFEGCREAIELLFDPDEPLTATANWLLALALSWNQAEVTTLATDTLIAAAEDGRYDPAALGTLLKQFVAVKELVPQRWLDPLGQVAACSPLHSELVRSTLEHALASTDHTHHIKRLSGPLDLLKELTAETGEPIVLEECRLFLESIGGKGKNAQRAAAILATTGRGARRSEIERLAILGRLERADRWRKLLGPR